MNKEEAKRIIRKTFEQPFDKNRFVIFIKNLLNQIEESTFSHHGIYIPDAYRPYISLFERVGKFNDGENRIDILIVKLAKDTSFERARTRQRNFIAGYLQGKYGSSNKKDAALVAFIAPNDADWRFSLVRMDYRFKETATGKIKIEEEFTSARRWSFLVGINEKSHTAQSQLIDILADDEKSPNLSELEAAFDIETVTKEFFLKYRDLFIRTKEFLDEIVDSCSKVEEDFKEKNINTVDFAKKLLGQIVFLYFLQKKGWFGVKRDNNWGSGSKHFLRELFEKRHGDYNNFFNDILEPLFYQALRMDRSHDDNYYSHFNCKIPFLNGGLFDPIGNYDWVHTDIMLPDNLFSNQNRTEQGDIGDGILDIFDRYNFTVQEDEPLEKEVAIDPELLGKAYEKFNAIRSDNFEEYKEALKSGRRGAESKFNKQYGVYYTPREIVHYMCQQSLINYLATESEGKISKDDIETLIHFGEQVSENEARVFEKGKETTTYSYKLPESIRKNASFIDGYLKNITVCDPAVGSGAFPLGMMSEVIKIRNLLSIFIQDNKRTPYEFKRRCIEHSLYGVDIDSGAVEIAKLRLWLSLIVDEDDIKNIKPLPNLDYKIVCGNSLLGVEKNVFNNALFEELETLKPVYFNETNPTQKQELKGKIDELINQITNGHKEFDFEVYFSEVFHHKGGFDVVIANPPYVNVKNEERKKYSLYVTLQSSDLFSFFFEKATTLLIKGGVLTFITSSLYVKGLKFQSLRTFLEENYILISLRIEGDRVFENVQIPTGIFIGRKSKLKKNKDKEWSFNQYTSNPILEKMLINSVILGDLTCSIRGLEIGRDKLRNQGKYKIISGSEIQKYYIENTKYISEHIFQEFKKNIYYFTGKRILLRETGSVLTSVYTDDANLLSTRTLFSIKLKSNDIDYKYLLAILNSKLLQYFYIVKFKSDTDIFPKIRMAQVRQLPIKINNLEIQKPFIDLVNKILAITKDDDYLNNPGKQAKVKQYEKQIDQLVYKLYGLTPEEIKIIEDI